MLIPDYVKRFGYIPYAEAAVGIENIFNVGRVDLVWRITHNSPDAGPLEMLGVRARWALNF
jgi:hypothetical protein